MTESRRTFLKETALLAAGALGGSFAVREGARAADSEPGPAPAGVPEGLAPFRKLPARMKLSCAAYSYRQLLEKEKAMTIEGFIERCAAMGLDGTELTSYFIYKTDPASLAALKRRAALLGLDISGTAVGNDFARQKGPEREKDIQHVKTWIEHAARLGAPTMRIFAGATPRGDSEDVARARVVEAIEECCEHAARFGVVLALENHGGLTATAEGTLAILKAVKSPWLGLNLDTGNFHTEDPYRDLELVAPHAVVVQMKVEVTAKGKTAAETNFERVLKMLRASNYRGYVAVEYEAREDPLTAVPRYVEKLKGLLA